MTALGLFYLTITVFPLALNLATKQRADAVGLSALVIITFAISKAMRLGWDPPDALRLYCVMDFISGCVALQAWRTQKEWWKLGLTFAFGFELCADVAFWTAYAVGHATDTVTLYTYMVVYNLACIAGLMLLCVGGVRSVAGAGLARFADRLHHAPHSGA